MHITFDPNPQLNSERACQKYVQYEFSDLYLVQK